MTLLPVVARELRAASRRSASYWGRAAAALVALGVFAWVFLMERGTASSRLGQTLFGAIATLAYGFAALAGVLFSADSISREKREGTLGLLFLTDLRGVDVALGKLTASSLAAVYGLLAIFPVLGVCVLLGGITGAEYGRMMLVLGGVLLTSLALGLLASTLAQDSVPAVTTAFALIVVWQVGAPLAGGVLGLVLDRLGWNERAVTEAFTSLRWLTPITAMANAFAGEYKQNAGAFLHAVNFCGVIGLAALGLASFRLPRIWQVSEGRRRLGFGAWLKRLRFGPGDGWAQFRRTLLELHPVVWLAGRHWLRRWLVWAWLVGGALLYTLLAAISGDNDWWELAALMAVLFPVHAFLKLWAALEAPRQFFADQRSGALELLLTTPLDLRELVRGRLLAHRRQFLRPTLAVAAGEGFLILRQFFEHPNEGDNLLFLVFAFAHIGTLLFDVITLGWVGNWIGLSARGNRSTVYAVLQILVLPWMIWLVAFPTVAFVIKPTLSGHLNWAMVTVLAWLALMCANNFFWLARARRGLLGRFRETAAGSRRSAAKAE